jgi:hypothetical protein
MERGDRATLIGEFVELAVQFKQSALPWLYWLVLDTKRRMKKDGVCELLSTRRFYEIVWLAPLVIGA